MAGQQGSGPAHKRWTAEVNHRPLSVLSRPSRYTAEQASSPSLCCSHTGVHPAACSCLHSRDFEQLWRTNTADLLGPSQAAEQTLKKLRQLEYGVLERVLGSNVYAQYVSQHLQLHVSKQPRTQQASRVDKAAWASIQRSALAASQLLGSSSSSQSAAATPLLDGPVAYEPPTYHVKCSRCQTVLPRSCLALHRCGQKQLIPRCMMQELASQCGVAWAAGEPCFLCECSTEEGERLCPYQSAVACMGARCLLHCNKPCPQAPACVLCNQVP